MPTNQLLNRNARQKSYRVAVLKNEYQVSDIRGFRYTLCNSAGISRSLLFRDFKSINSTHFDEIK